MAQHYKNYDITKSRVKVFLGWENFNPKGNVAPGRMDQNLCGRLWTCRTSDPVSVSVASPSDQNLPLTPAALAALTFRPAKVGDKFGPTFSTHVFRLDITIPRNMHNRSVHLIWDSNSEALVLSEQALPIQGLVGGDHWARRADYPLFPDRQDSVAKENETVRIYMQIACNGLFGAGRGGDIEPPDMDRFYTLEECCLAVFDPVAWALIHDLTLLSSLAENLPDSPRRTQALYTANDVINAVDVSDPLTYDAGRQIAAKFLSCENGQSQVVIHSMLHSHIDLAWLWPMAVTPAKGVRTFSTHLRLLDKYPECVFVQSQAQLYQWVKDSSPPLWLEICRRVKEGRFVPVGATWVEMDCNIPSGESLVRQFLLGQRFFMDNFGMQCKEFWLPDTFGYSAQLPQIMKGCGVDNFMTIKLSWNLFNKFPHSTFVWEGLDGSRVLAHMPPANTYNAQAFPEEVMRSADKNKDVGVVPDSVMLVGHGDGGGGASPAMLESMRRMRDLDGVPLVQFSTPTRFFAEVKKKEHELPRWVGELYFELHRGTYTTQANTKKKNRQCESLLRDVEILSSQALVMSILSGQYFKYPVETLDKCWKLVLKNCFHDTLPGSCIAEVYKETDRDYREVLGECTSLKNEALSFIGQHLVACAPKKRAKRNSEVKDKDNFSKNGSNHSKPNLLLFMHGTGFHIPKDRLRAVEIDASVHHALPVGTVVQKVGLHFPRAIEAESSRTRTLVACKPNFGGIGSVLNPHLLRSEEGESFEKAVSVEIVGCNEARRVLLKNNKVRAEFSVSGCLESLVLMSANGVSREALTTSSDSEEASCTGGNVLVLYDDLTQFWCGWDTEVWSYEKCKLIGDAVRCEIIEDGPLRAGVYFEYPLTKSGSKIEQFITLQAESERIDFRTEVDWKESRKILRVLFHTQIRSPHAHYDSQFGHVRRPTTFNHSWEIAKFEVVGHQYCDLSEHNFGVALLNDCKYGYSVRDSTMRLSLLRAAKSPDDMADIGVHTMTYGLLPHWGSFPCKVVLDEAADLNWPPQLIVTDEESHGDSVGHSEWVFKVVSGRADLLDTVVVSAIKRAENSPDRIVLRMYETMGGRGKAMLSCPSGMLIASVKECDMLEDDIKWGSDVVLSQAVSEGGIVSTRIEIPFRPFQIRSLLVHCK